MQQSRHEYLCLTHISYSSSTAMMIPVHVRHGICLLISMFLRRIHPSDIAGGPKYSRLVSKVTRPKSGHHYSTPNILVRWPQIFLLFVASYTEGTTLYTHVYNLYVAYFNPALCAKIGAG